ncbi:hypothetical protein ON010_g16392 [Phytophthora cinnamomi]|nr:hypothetical protein ON010_g16392 [Phytophthora cinnamomi]
MLVQRSLYDEPFLRYLFKNTDQPEALFAADNIKNKRIITVNGYDAYVDAMIKYEEEENPVPTFLMMVSGRFKNNKRPWCPYCRYSELPLEYAFYAYAPKNARMIRVEVTDSYAEWRKRNDFTRDENLQLRIVPLMFKIDPVPSAGPNATKSIKFTTHKIRFKSIVSRYTKQGEDRATANAVVRLKQTEASPPPHASGTDIRHSSILLMSSQREPLSHGLRHLVDDAALSEESQIPVCSRVEARGRLDGVSVATADDRDGVENREPYVCRLKLFRVSVESSPLRSRDSRLRADKLHRHRSLGIFPVLPAAADARVSRLLVVGSPNGSAGKIDCLMASSIELQVEAVERMGEFEEHIASLNLMPELKMQDYRLASIREPSLAVIRNGDRARSAGVTWHDLQSLAAPSQAPRAPNVTWSAYALGDTLPHGAASRPSLSPAWGNGSLRSASITAASP